jgi:hypothetical protein
VSTQTQIPDRSPYYTGYVPHEPSAAERLDPDNPIDLNEQIARAEADMEEQRRREGVRIARRLVVAFGLIVLMFAMCWFVLPRMGLDLPPAVPIAAFAAILFGTFMATVGDRDTPPEDDDLRLGDSCDGHSCGCGGPRPIGELSRKARRN